MEVRIRLQKSDTKAKGRYNYRVVAIPKADPRQSKALEILGYYDSAQDPAVYNLKLDKIDKWVSNGAQMTHTVRSLVKQARKNV